MSTSAEGSVNGKKLGRKRILSFSPNSRRRKYSSVPLRWAKVTPSSTTRPSTWKNMGRWVGSGTSRRKTLPGMMIRMGGFCFSMTRIWTGEVCVRSRQVVVDVERVPGVPGRMVGREVERLEIVVVGLDLGPLGDREAHLQEDVLDLLLEEPDGWAAPQGRRSPGRVRSISARGAAGALSLASSAASRSWTSILRSLISWPAAGRSSAGRAFISSKRRVTEPRLRLRNWLRTSSRALRSRTGADSSASFVR